MQSIPDDARTALARVPVAEKVARDTEHVISALQDAGYYTEEIGAAADNGTIVNLLRDGEYLLTLTITKTPGY